MSFKRLPLLFCFLFGISTATIAQKKLQKLKERTLETGYILYKSELASWHSTDLLNDSFPEIRKKSGGYLSYTEGNTTRALYFDHSENSKVIFEVTYDDILVFRNKYTVDTISRTTTELEERLLLARTQAINRINTDEESFFKFYNNTSYNLIPIVNKNKVEVYSITGPQMGGVVLIGNDYFFSFDKKDQLKDVVKIHNSLLSFPYKSEEGESELEQIFYNQVVEEYPIIPPTDICTTLLYKEYVEWNKLITLGASYVSIWNMDKEELIILTREAWDAISSDKE